jgi:hypothetical protein
MDEYFKAPWSNNSFLETQVTTPLIQTPVIGHDPKFQQLVCALYNNFLDPKSYW